MTRCKTCGQTLPDVPLLYNDAMTGAWVLTTKKGSKSQLYLEAMRSKCKATPGVCLRQAVPVVYMSCDGCANKIG